MRALMFEEMEFVSGGRAENSANGNVCGGSGCGGTRSGSGNGSGSPSGSGNSGNGTRPGVSPSLACGISATAAMALNAYSIAIAADNPALAGIAGGLGTGAGIAAGLACGR